MLPAAKLPCTRWVHREDAQLVLVQCRPLRVAGFLLRHSRSFHAYLPCHALFFGVRSASGLFCCRMPLRATATRVPLIYSAPSY